MSGSDDMNDLDRAASRGTASRKDTKMNIQQMLRRRYQQSRGSPSSNENPSPIPGPVSFRPPARQKQKKINMAPSSGAEGGSEREGMDANGNFVFENNFDSLPNEDEVIPKTKGQSQGHLPKSKAQGQRERRNREEIQFDDVWSAVIGEISTGENKGAKSKKQGGSEARQVFENNFDDMDQPDDDVDPSPPPRGEYAPQAPQQLPRQQLPRQQLPRQQLPRQQLPKQQFPRQPNTGSQRDGHTETVHQQANFRGRDVPTQAWNSDHQIPLRGRDFSQSHSNDQDPEEKAREREQRLQKLRRPRQLPTFNPLARLNMMSENKDESGDEMMDGSSNDPIGDRSQPDDVRAGNELNDLMQTMIPQSGNERNDVKDPLGLGGVGGGEERGGANKRGGGEEMMRLMAGFSAGPLEGADGDRMPAALRNVDLTEFVEGGGASDPLAQMMALLDGKGDPGEKLSAFMEQEKREGRDNGEVDLSELMAMFGEGSENPEEDEQGGRAGDMSQMMAMFGEGIENPGIPKEDEQGGRAGDMSQMMEMFEGRGPGAPKGGGQGGGAVDQASQMKAIIGGGRRAGGVNEVGVANPMSPFMIGGQDRGSGQGGARRGGVREDDLTNPMSQIMIRGQNRGSGQGGGSMDGLVDPRSQMMAMMGGGQQAAQHEDKEIDIENASLDDQLQQLLGYERLKAQSNKSPKSDGMCTIIIIDTSASMQGDPITKAGQFISQFLNGLEEVQFEYELEENVAVVCVGREVHVLQHLTTDYTAVRRAVDTVYADGPSPLHLALILPLSVLVLDPKQGRDYIANKNGHHICPRIIVISDGHPSTLEDIPGESGVANRQESQAIQTLCGELLQTVRDRTLSEVYCVPVGIANIAFLEQISNSFGGRLMKPSDAKQMSRTYLHHFMVGNLMASGHDTSNRATVAALVQKAMGCSDKADVDAVMKILSQGEPNIEGRNRAIVEQNGQGAGGGGGEEGQNTGAMMQSMMSGLMGGGQGGGSDMGAMMQSMMGQLMGGGQGGGSDMGAMMQSMMGGGQGGGPNMGAMMQSMMGGGQGGGPNMGAMMQTMMSGLMGGGQMDGGQGGGPNIPGMLGGPNVGGHRGGGDMAAIMGGGQGSGQSRGDQGGGPNMAAMMETMMEGLGGHSGGRQDIGEDGDGSFQQEPFTVGERGVAQRQRGGAARGPHSMIGGGRGNITDMMQSRIGEGGQFPLAERADKRQTQPRGGQHQTMGNGSREADFVIDLDSEDGYFGDQNGGYDGSQNGPSIQSIKGQIKHRGQQGEPRRRGGPGGMRGQTRISQDSRHGGRGFNAYDDSHELDDDSRGGAIGYQQSANPGDAQFPQQASRRPSNNRAIREMLQQRQQRGSRLPRRKPTYDDEDLDTMDD